ncbi:hypothetical protein BGZ61DRAFT_457065 [Ilyonectria robusta]|uniref:uncharacterized protein n=1 Tax=Ilyonectria robusta TaxID=1079257 RepID=UPI001E8DDE24|nr:uncharacterized protein BGZ61DRAFT_457065 [Ilyonectria robusta]KAH8679342.1 hypothetical protein BGZ61DRAFT_457065 [Ilyonectria robusta]
MDKTALVHFPPLQPYTLLSPAPSLPRSSSEDAPPVRRVTPRRRPIPRKGHTKSRRGCLNCKRRKVKCQETLPGCGHCERLGLACEYPSNTDSALAMPAPAMALQATPTQFTMEDLRLFQHFIFHAYPPLPLKGDSVWREVAALSHSFDFLIHAMLGLAASHLSLGTNADYTSQALTHRVYAIGSLNQALNTPCATKAEGDARFATMMALTFQASYMPEGMQEFLSMIRGCIVVSDTAMPYFTESVFHTFSPERHEQSVHELNQEPSHHGQNADIFKDALISSRALGPLCRGVLEVRYLGIIERILKATQRSDVDAYIEVSAAYRVLGEGSAPEFDLFIDASNYTAQIIMMHFFIIEYVVGLNALTPVMDSFPFRRAMISSWILELEQKLPVEYKQYMRWPMDFAQCRDVEQSRFVEVVDG